MKKTSILKRATSIACAAAMALTMTPFAAGAFGSDQSKAYAANDPVPQVGANVCMTVPLFVTFGGEEGYDVSNPASSITSDFSLVNSGKTNAYVSQIVSKDLGATKLFYKMNGTEGKPAVGAEDPLFSLYEKDDPSQKINFGPGDETENGKTFTKGSGVLIGTDENTSTTCTFRLNLTNANEVENACFAVNTDNLVDAGTAATGDKRNYDTVNKLAQLKITIKGTKFSVDFARESDWVSGSFTGKTETQLQTEKVPIYLIDNELGEIYSIADIWKQRDHIQRNGEDSFYTKLYREFALDPSKYICKMQFGTEANYEPIVVADAYVDRFYNPQYINCEQGKDSIVFHFRNGIGKTTASLANSSPYGDGKHFITGRDFKSGSWYGIQNPRTNEPNAILSYLGTISKKISDGGYLSDKLVNYILNHPSSALCHDGGGGTFLQDGLMLPNSGNTGITYYDTPNLNGLWTRFYLKAYNGIYDYRYYSDQDISKRASVGGFGSGEQAQNQPVSVHTGSYGTSGGEFFMTTSGNYNMTGSYNTERAVRPFFVL
ncbi:hypothetical protein [Adlercreutzia sp. ZJ154]|uniref:hypothetical protein n=1 Tax=Adlercreutzia sp. ZJ154 TaxID=2709790 RepID=UPI0013EA06F7|nr:hypothetical protein [Adlercreutzia sp. ZJ154]